MKKNLNNLTTDLYTADDIALDALVEEEENRALFRRARRNYEGKLKKKRETREKRVAKKMKNVRIWADLPHPQGTATRYFDWQVVEDDDDIYLNIVKTTERHDALRVRKSLEKSADQIAESLTQVQEEPELSEWEKAWREEALSFMSYWMRSIEREFEDDLDDFLWG